MIIAKYRPYKCKHCGKSYYRNYLLQIHTAKIHNTNNTLTSPQKLFRIDRDSANSYRLLNGQVGEQKVIQIKMEVRPKDEQTGRKTLRFDST